ncbi:autophagy-related protein 11-domain-containing protein [Endogone sp. FLAS-F59071]|nr:autophagy-related protein 11-domain-containing protein [Endogone sp. FLAS-F59071]|eukprot:RUS13631.1 autophagy-related protein 11-domain-containing protein [Endogone sp. FLAS-F59071]
MKPPINTFISTIHTPPILPQIAELEQTLDQQQNENAQQQNENTQRMTHYEQRLRSQREEYERVLAAQREKMERQSEETYRENEQTWKRKVAERETEMEEARRIWAEERENLMAQLEGLRLGMNNSEEAREDIKQRLAQAREMAAHAEKDWMEKNEALMKMTAEFEESRRLALDCLRLIETPKTPAEERAQGQDNMNDVLHTLMENITSVTAARDGLEQSLKVSHDHVNELELDLVAERERTADEARRRAEAEALATDLAAQLHSYHRGVADGLVKGLKLELEVEAPLEATVEAQAEAEGADRTPREILKVAKKVDVREVVKKVKVKMIERQEALKKWEKAYKVLKEKYAETSDKIAFRNFKLNDVALFLPTRNSTGKPWAAFNIHAPHYFLKPTERVSDQLASREWIVARIVSMTECIVDSMIPDSNPYGLADGIKFYQLEGEPWADKTHKSSRNRSSRDDAQLSPSSSTTLNRSNVLSNSVMMSASGVMNQSQVQADAPVLAGSIIGSGGLTSPVSPTSTSSRRASTTNAGSPNMPYDTVSLTDALPALSTQQSIFSALTPSLTRRNNGPSPSPLAIANSRVQRESTPPMLRYDRNSPSLPSSEFLDRERANELHRTDWTAQQNL